MRLTPQEFANYQCDVVFVGRCFSPREEMFKGLGGKKVAIWGSGNWDKNPTVKRYIDVEQAVHSQILPPPEAAKLYNAAAICLNLNHRQTIFNGLNQRGFEIPACGGFQLVDYRPGFESLFAANEEIVYYHSFDEISDLVEYYLSHPDERKKIARRGYERVIEGHSYEHRMKKVLAWANSQLQISSGS
jgi:spore maturation protein CgeB